MTKFYPGFPHGVSTTYAEQINAGVLDFYSGISSCSRTSRVKTRIYRYVKGGVKKTLRPALSAWADQRANF